MATQNNISRNPNSLSSHKLKTYVQNGYLISHAAVYLFVVLAILAGTIHRDYYLSPFHQILVIYELCSTTNAAAAVLFLLAATLILLRRPMKVYLVDFACYNHPPSFLSSRETLYRRLTEHMSPESYAFSRKVLENSGVSENVYLYGVREGFPPESVFNCAREEAEIVISGAVDDLLAKTGVDPGDIGVVIVNISTFNPVPSLSAMIVNRYKLGKDVLTYNLGGMGCGAGIIAIDLAKRLLQVQRNTYALITSLECPTASYYLGDDKSKLLANMLFRMGGAALLLSSRPSDCRTSKYELKHTVRTHLGADDRAYKCVVQEEDKVGKLGITISKELMSVAGEALKANITALGPLVLPVSEQLHFVATLVAKRVFKTKSGVRPYVPDFKLAFEHFCVHAGGRSVLDEVEKNLKLTKWDMEPSRMTLYRYSNTSSSSLWYELAYAEAKGRIKKGDRVWQIGFGSGFKCGSAVWRALRTINPNEEDNPWIHVIHQFPVQ